MSDELAGAIAQVQGSVQVSLASIRSRLDVKGEDGAPTGETLFFYQPRSFLVIGSLAEFRAAHGINEEKYSSFELFRRSVSAPEIITFDELLERARFIVEAGEQERQDA
ncbi:Shedu anti-phage system protein SduA domain-containing protein [Paraburkholderia steynii]|uniref:Shedu anti-phage system protein SduA domain-containing protein n=1 Tax=Paraburkholderia steynii TaxID=1245441 RepID=UPI0024484E56|nr:Shedu anti-phage system protein SduA domain-containing protein [Paraburkholderia steynii]